MQEVTVRGLMKRRPIRLGGLGADGTFKPSSVLDLIGTVAPHLINAQGQWTPFDAAAQLYDTVEIRTNATPPIVLNVRELGASDTPNPIAQKLQPTVILSGPLGQKVLAPYGVASPTIGTAVSIGATVLVGMGLGALGFIVGSMREKKRTRRAASRISAAVASTR